MNIYELFAITGLIQTVCGFIVPDEIPSLLSVIYSNIPTIKKGTDSRLGWGFRLGDRADFQIIVELGPQTNTRPLANQQNANNNNKRNTVDNLANLLFAQNQRNEPNINVANLTVTNDKATAVEDGKKWLTNWSKSFKQNKVIGVGEIDAKAVLPPTEQDKNY